MFEDRVSPDNHGCLVWTGTLLNGYGYVFRDGTNRYAHRLVFEAARGSIPENLEIDHLCRNRACVNIFHLELVPSRVNTLRGDGPSARAARRVTCPKGHPYDAVNTIKLTKNGKFRKRMCRICRNAYKRKLWARDAARVHSAPF